MELSRITAQERADCALFAVELAKGCVAASRGYIHPNSRIGTLSDREWAQLAMSAVSGWIAERSRQAGKTYLQEENILTVGQTPEPAEIGVARLALAPMGDLVEGLELTDKAITEWSEYQVCVFIWTAAEVLNRIRSRMEAGREAIDAAAENATVDFAP